jgi:hypothetical protein
VFSRAAVLVAAMLFLYGASRNAGGTSGQTRTRSGWRFNRNYSYGCAVLRGGVFVTSSIASGVATACAIAAYVNLHAAEPEPEPGVAMGQPSQWPHQPYPPTAPGQFAQPGVAMGQPQPYPPVAYPAAPHHGYGYAKQPPGTA